ncbi:hypothetical protein [Cellulomonas hominis]
MVSRLPSRTSRPSHRPVRLPSRRVRGSAAVALALVSALGLTACSTTNPQTTTRAYSPSDGVRAEVGQLTAENLLIVSAAAGEPGALQGALTNRGTERLTVTVSTADQQDAATLRVTAGETLLLGGEDGTDVTFTTTDPPGATTDLTLTTGQGGTESVAVPVLDGTLPEYAALVPAADTATAG